MDINRLKNVLARNGLRPNFTYGQNFLVDENALDDIVKAAGIKKSDAVLEIGPGIGNLTEKLLQRAGFVLSIEKDPKFYPLLRALKKNHRENFRFEIADALEVDFLEILNNQSGYIDYRNPDLQIATDPSVRKHPQIRMPSAYQGRDYKVVANIPYYITGKILQTLLNAKIKPQSITILTQKEVAENIIAKAGDLSVLAISVQLYGRPKIIRTVPADSFYPAPKVDSAILQIDLYKKPKYDLGDEKKFFRVLKSCFAGKRKQIHNTLQNNLRLPKEQVEKILSETKISPASRPQELAIEQWIELAKKIKD
ncbi:MAG: 16S rRNA (adenine(1518)-N(6)/adenine(1519)-N(6))-dimethyltransferase RsmA [Patescibacteria group bacterium]|nr:16S rRNA (adenine(1518)-N(6)/adenine(1519)-N(6))-dimethyltransferase RsmA [Patescibacteria group bacterium]